ncbi:Trm112 family protein [Mariniluteicoccus endophyticus]
MTTPHLELPREVVEILACPSCHSGLAVDHDSGELVCTSGQCGLAYPVVDGIPVLLIDEARRA